MNRNLKIDLLNHSQGWVGLEFEPIFVGQPNIQIEFIEIQYQHEIYRKCVTFSVKGRGGVKGNPTTYLLASKLILSIVYKLAITQ